MRSPKTKIENDELSRPAPRRERLKELRKSPPDESPTATTAHDRETAEFVRRCRRSAREIAGPGADPMDVIRAFQASFNLALALKAQKAGAADAAAGAVRRLQEGPPPEGMVDPEWVRKAHRTAMRDVFTIFGGDETNDFPECVLVGTSTGFCCSGVLIHERAVLTAAHCTGGFGCAASRIGIGSDQDNLDRSPISVADVKIEPGYIPDADHPKNDVAVLILSEKVTGITFPKFAKSDKIDAAISITAVGFGNTNAAGTTGFGTKRQAVINVRSRACVGNNAPNEFGCLPNKELVAISLNTSDTCTGDSGGPIYVTSGGALLLAGITSRRIKSEIAAVCGVGGIYPRIDAYHDFIKGVLDTL